jgi:PHAX RNA-binding domain
MATEDTVSTIAKALGESDEIPLGQIGGVVRALGDELCLKLLEETQHIEAKGGMMLPDNSRKRTAGGVFFYLTRQKLSPEDKLSIFRAAKPAKPASAPVSESSPFPRRRVIDVMPARPVAAARASRPGFVPPELPVAVRRVKVKEAVLTSLSTLPAEDQYGVLLDLIAELHDKLGYRVPESQRAQVFDPPTRPGATLGGPPSSQRPIPIPESTRSAPESARHVTGAPPADVPDKPKRTAVRAKRSS